VGHRVEKRKAQKKKVYGEDWGKIRNWKEKNDTECRKLSMGGKRFILEKPG